MLGYALKPVDAINGEFFFLNDRRIKVRTDSRLKQARKKRAKRRSRDVDRADQSLVVLWFALHWPLSIVVKLTSSFCVAD